VRDDAPQDPFAGDPTDPASELGDDEAPDEPLSDDERRDLLEDLQDIDAFQALLEPRGVRGLVVDCDDCREPHFFAWELLRANLRSLLDLGSPHVHEPAYSPDPSDYVSWDYARGFLDGVLTLDDDGPNP
jgi:Family of unknown function (DUF5319)